MSLTLHRFTLHTGTHTLIHALDPTLHLACALTSGCLRVPTDALARTFIAPRELPVGVLTAMLGVPMMLWLLRRP